MANSLIKMKRRIASVKSTKKTTKAMELIATTKLKKYKSIMGDNTFYSDEISKTIKFLDLSESDESLNRYYKDGPSEKTLYIVINSSLGLCGSYNYDVYRFVSENIATINSYIAPMGTKGEKYYSSLGYEVNLSYLHYNQTIDYDKISKLAQILVSQFEEGKYKSIKLVYTHFINQLTFVPQMVDIFPLSTEEKKEDVPYGPIIDGDPKEIFEQLLPLYINSLLQEKIIESMVCEQAIRRLAMENANDNADELIEELTIKYNKERQNSITDEISEIVSSSLR